jgi:hypothetical protein
METGHLIYQPAFPEDLRNPEGRAELANQRLTVAALLADLESRGVYSGGIGDLIHDAQALLETTGRVEATESGRGLITLRDQARALRYALTHLLDEHGLEHRNALEELAYSLEQGLEHLHTCENGKAQKAGQAVQRDPSADVAALDEEFRRRLFDRLLEDENVVMIFGEELEDYAARRDGALAALAGDTPCERPKDRTEILGTFVPQEGE